jgi:hypothetical protein
MIVVPDMIPPAVPDEMPIVATDGLLLVHVPPVVASCSVVIAPIQIDFAPEIVSGSGFTVNTATVAQPVLSL